jgi:glycosyltransferase involved in cell wall biosynthesis
VLHRVLVDVTPWPTTTLMRLLYVSNFLEAHANVSYCRELSDRLEVAGVAMTRTSTKENRIARLADMVATVIARRAAYDIAIVDVFSGPAFLWAEAACFALRRVGKPYVLTLHGGNLPAFAQRSPRRVRRLLAGAAKVTAPSRYMQTLMRPYRGDIVLVPNAVDTVANAFVERAVARPRAIWVRAFHAIYNPELAAEAVALACRAVPELALVMLGPDKGDGSREAFTRRVHDLGVEGRIEMLGRVEKQEVARHLAAADIFLNTTNVDNTPISVLEALSAGLCVISTNVGGIPYLLEHERTALLVPQGDAGAMSSAIERIVVDPALAQRLSAHGRALAMQHDWSTVLGAWQRLFAEIA